MEKNCVKAALEYEITKLTCALPEEHNPNTTETRAWMLRDIERHRLALEVLAAVPDVFRQLSAALYRLKGTSVGRDYATDELQKLDDPKGLYERIRADQRALKET